MSFRLLHSVSFVEQSASAGKLKFRFGRLRLSKLQCPSSSTLVHSTLRDSETRSTWSPPPYPASGPPCLYRIFLLPSTAGGGSCNTFESRPDTTACNATICNGFVRTDKPFAWYRLLGRLLGLQVRASSS